MSGVYVSRTPCIIASTTTGYVLTVMVFFFSLGSNDTLEIVKNIVALLGPVNATTFRKGADGLDVSYWEKDGVPGGSILNHNEHYFWFHHSDG